MKKVSVLFVCMGNICRSPTAEGVFRHLIRQEKLEDIIQIDSAGTHAYHVGNPPDTRAQATAVACSRPQAEGVPLARWSYAEIAQILGVTPKAVEGLISRAGASLQARLSHFKKNEKS